MKFKDKKVSGEFMVDLFTPIMSILMTIFIVSGIFSYYNTAKQANKFNELNNEVDIFFQKIVIGEIKDKYIIKKVESTNICMALINKQKKWWKVIEIENKLVDISKMSEIHKSCSVKHDEINIKFSNPILEIKEPQ